MKLSEIPGPKARRLIKKAERECITTTQDSPIVVERADKDGLHIWTVDKQRLFDGISGIGVNNTGVGHKKIKAAMMRVVANGLWQYIFNDFPNPLSIRLCRELNQLAPGDVPRKTLLVNSGTEAIEGALKLAFAHRPGANTVISFYGAFHGRTLGALPLMASSSIRVKDFPFPYQVARFPYPSCQNCEYGKSFHSDCYGHCFCINQIARALKRTPHPKNVAAVVIEFVQGEGGINIAGVGPMQELARLCQKHKIPLIDDEIQTGFGRTGHMWACDYFGIVPDMIAVAKALTSGGAPAGAVIARADLDFDEMGLHSNTYGGHRLAAACALATIRILDDEKLIENAAAMGSVLSDRLIALQQDHRPYIKDHRGLGLMQAIEIADRAGRPFPQLRDAIIDEALKRGLILAGCGHDDINPTVRLLPPLIIQEEHIREIYTTLCEAVQAARKALSV